MMYCRIFRKKLVSGSTLHDLSRSLSVDTISALNKNTLRASCTQLCGHNVTVLSNKPSFLQSKPNACTVTTGHRYYCKDYRPFPEVPDFPPVVWPNLFKSVKALLYTYLIIKPQFDNDFSLGEFAKNSRKVFGVFLIFNFFSSSGLVNYNNIVTVFRL